MTNRSHITSRLKVTLRAFVGVVFFITLASLRPIVLVVDLKLVEAGWDKHFKDHKNDEHHPHVDFLKFQTLDEKETFMVCFPIPKDFNVKTLKRGNTFEVGLASFGDIESINEGIRVNVKNKKDLERFEKRLMMGIEPK